MSERMPRFTPEEERNIPENVRELGGILEKGTYSRMITPEGALPIKIDVWQRSTALESAETVRDPLLNLALFGTKAPNITTMHKKRTPREWLDRQLKALKLSSETTLTRKGALQELERYDEVYDARATVGGEERRVQFIGELHLSVLNSAIRTGHNLEISDALPLDSIIRLDHSHACINVIVLTPDSISGFTLPSWENQFGSTLVQLLRERGADKPGACVLYSSGIRNSEVSRTINAPRTNRAVTVLERAVKDLGTSGTPPMFERAAPRISEDREGTDGTTMLADGKTRRVVVILNDVKKRLPAKSK
jgi:hypothetical protein